MIERHNSAHHSRPVDVLALAAMMIGASCNQGEVLHAAPESAREARGFPKLNVVHVASERRLYAGTPIDSIHIVTALHWDDAGLSAVVAEGIPFAWDTLHAEPGVPDFGDSAAFPAIGFFAAKNPADFAPNTIAIDAPLSIGQRVLIAGFPAVSGQLQSRGYWSVAPTVRTARVVEIRAEAQRSLLTEEIDTIILSAPADDYRGFLGGPVGVDTPDGAIHVVAVLAQQVTAHGNASEGNILLIARPIRRILEGMPR